MMTIALSIQLHKAILGDTVEESIPAYNKVIEILFDVEKLSIEWCILELAFNYEYFGNIKYVEIIKYWNGDELSAIITAESNGLRDEQARSYNRVLSEYNGREESYPESV